MSDNIPKRAATDDDNVETVDSKNDSSTPKRAQPKKSSRWRKILLVFFVCLMIVGVYFIYEGAQVKPKNNAPHLGQAISAPNAPIAGPESATVNDRGKAGEKDENRVITPETMEPNHIFIPALGIYAYINTEGTVGTIDAANSLVLPTAHQVTRYVDGSNVTDPEGNILIAGHVEWYGEKGALYNLGNIKAGNLAYVTDADNNVEEFKLTDAKQTYKDKFPQDLLNKSKKGPKQLNVVTCTDLRYINGEWVYDENLIATFTPVQ